MAHWPDDEPLRKLRPWEPITFWYAVRTLDRDYRSYGGPDARHRPGTLEAQIIEIAERTVRRMAATAKPDEIAHARAKCLRRTREVIDRGLRAAGRPIP